MRVCIVRLYRFILRLGSFACVASIPLMADYNGALPSNITLKGNSTQNAVMNCQSYWECVFGNTSYTSTIGATTKSTLTLNAILPPNPQSQTKQTPFYIGTLNIQSGADVVLANFSSFTLGSSLNINGGSLTFNNNAAGFGSYLNTNISVSNGGRLSVSANSFRNQGNIHISSASSFLLSSGNTRNEGTITNDGGTLTITSPVYNIGQGSSIGGSPSSVAGITNNGGSITITRLVNGGQIPIGSSGVMNCRVGGCGGGNLTINGGTVTVQQQVISQPMDNQPSTITINGGILSANGGVDNKFGSTLTFGVLNGVMGKIQGNLTNTGTVIVDLAGAKAGSYELVSGYASGLDSISIKNGNNAFGNASFSGKSINFTLNNDVITSFKSSLNGNEFSTLNALDEGIYTLGGANSASLKNMANEINAGVFSLGFSLPFIIGSNMQNALTQQEKLGASVSAIALGVFGGTSGFMGGLKGGYAFSLGNASLSASAAYARGSFTHTSDTDLASQDSTLSAQSAGVSVGLLLPLQRAKLGINALCVGVFGNGNRVLKISDLRTTHILQSSSNLLNFGLDSILAFKSSLKGSMGGGILNLGYFIGVKQNLALAQAFSETGSNVALQSPAFNAYLLKLTGGGEIGGFSAFGGIVSVGLHYEFLALSSEKRTFTYTVAQNSITSPLPYSHLVHLNTEVKREFGDSLLGVKAFVRGIFGDISNFYALGVSGSWHF